MRRITKRDNFEPNSLKAWKRGNRGKLYSDLKNGGAVVRQDIRNEALREQFYLCGYCCKSISGNNDCHNEHVEAQATNPNRTLDFDNLIVSCNTPRQCGLAHKSKVLPLTPLMPECESELKFKLSGQVVGLTERATDAIQILNLGDQLANNRALIEQRKQLVHVLLMANGVDAEDGLEDDDLLEMVVDDISTPQNGKLEAFAPVVVNILKQWLG
ncbi:hypothetical protein AB8S08_00575 [Pseudidiomarina sp. PP-1MA]|uniref:TIGR02646 family protein n=1 Tax=Pseudidiomarina sp. PP-1MA TaxID=3237706 RepID=A0AB39X7A0_9GAMM